MIGVYPGYGRYRNKCPPKEKEGDVLVEAWQDLESYEKRLLTFKSSSVAWPSHTPPEAAAAAGWYFAPSERDALECGF